MKTLIQTIFILLFVGIAIEGCSKDKDDKFEDLKNENNITILIQKCDYHEKKLEKKLASGEKDALKDMKILRVICGNTIRKLRRKDIEEINETDDVPMP